MSIPNPFTNTLQTIVDVVIEISPLALLPPIFNQALIVGSTAVIDPLDRVKQYQTLAQMISDHFQTTDPEYIAAALYFSQSPAPVYLWVGRQDAGNGETPLIAVEACRAINYNWWAFMVCGATKEDHIALTAWAQTASPPSFYFFTTSDAEVPLATVGNVFDVNKGFMYSRSLGQYSTDNPYAVAAIMGYAMGQNTGLNNSAYTLKFKNEIGIATEDIDPTQISNIEGNNGNVYLSYGNYYNIFEQGVVPSGQFFDEILGLDILAANIQISVMNVLYTLPKVPLTDPGMTRIITAINQACQQSVDIGFLAPGVWTGLPILNLNTNDTLSKGFLVQVPAVSTLTDAEREARVTPHFYVAIKEAGAAHSVLIGVYVNR